MRVFIISHSAVVPLYREKFHALARLGWEVELVLPMGWPEGGRWVAAPADGLEQGVRIHSLPGHFIGKVGGFFLTGVARCLELSRPDIVYVEEEPYSIVCWQTWRACQKLKIPMAFFTWENLFRGYKPPLRWIDHAVLRHVRWAIAGNQEAAQVLQQRGFQGETLVLPQYGIAPERYTPGTRVRQPGQPMVLGYMGRLLEEKGIHTLLRAAALLNFDFQLKIIGNGPHEANLRRLVAGLPLGSRVVFQPAVPNDQVAEQLVQLDVLILPSETRSFWMEQFGRILIEAMACEVTVVGSDSGEIPHVIGKAGLVVHEGDVGGLASGLTKLYEHPELARSLAQAGRQRALERYTTTSLAQRSAEFFQQMLAD